MGLSEIPKCWAWAMYLAKAPRPTYEPANSPQRGYWLPINAPKCLKMAPNSPKTAQNSQKRPSNAFQILWDAFPTLREPFLWTALEGPKKAQKGLFRPFQGLFWLFEGLFGSILAILRAFRILLSIWLPPLYPL